MSEARIMAAAEAATEAPLRVLLIEDDRLQVRIISQMLAGKAFSLESADCLSRGLERLATAPNVVLLDLGLPDSQGWDTFARVKAQAADLPIIVLSGMDDVDMAVKAVQGGAQDYLVKGRVDALLLARAIRYACERQRIERQLKQANWELQKANEALTREVREHQLTEAALYNSEALYRSLVDTLPITVLRKDLQGKVSFGNRRYCEEMGQPLEGLIGKTDYDLFPKALADKYVRDDQKVLQTGEVFEDIEGHQKPDGSKTYVHVLKAPVLNARHEVVGTQVIYWDVTARKNAEEQLKQAYADLQKTNEVLRATQLQLIEAEKMQSVGRLAAGVAHEVRNPLAVLGLGLDYLANVAAGDPVLTDMRNALKRADAIIYGLCEFSALNELQCQPADLNQVLEQALTMVEPECGEQGIRLVKELAANLPPVRFDPDKIKQVLVSLLTNAVQAMAGGGCLTVRTSARQLQADEVSQDAGSRQAERLHARALVAVVEISDTGPGVPAANLPKVFDAFFTTKPTGKGIGLGLTVSRKIIELHGGDLQLKNRPEGGLSAMLLLKAD